MLVVQGATLSCSFGTATSSLLVPPGNRPTVLGLPTANIGDHSPIANVPPFGLCWSLANPAVAAATTAALGTLTPIPCIPALPTPWTPGSPKTLVATLPALNLMCRCACVWGGIVSILEPGQILATSP
ncbi:MAG: DUF4280 domain-containing protein [Planctomycetaceae bacterium]